MLTPNHKRSILMIEDREWEKEDIKTHKKKHLKNQRKIATYIALPMIHNLIFKILRK